MMTRVEAILGKSWESHVEGQKLKMDGDSFRLKLVSSMQESFDAWSQRVQQRPPEIAGRIFMVENQRNRGSNMAHLRVDFHPEIISLWKEVRVKANSTCACSLWSQRLLFPYNVCA